MIDLTDYGPRKFNGVFESRTDSQKSGNLGLPRNPEVCRNLGICEKRLLFTFRLSLNRPLPAPKSDNYLTSSLAFVMSGSVASSKGGGSLKTAGSFKENKSLASSKEISATLSPRAKLGRLSSQTGDGINLANSQDDSSISKAVSFLSGDSVRWMNKRQPNTLFATRTRVQPSRALQIREVFRGLDYDNSGSIDIEELKEAVLFVARATTTEGEEPLFKDPNKLMEFFVAMDTNGDGTVDFNEFLLALTSQANEGDNEAERLHQAFFDFANQHRRQKILDFVKERDISDLEKYKELKKLFTIQYFRVENVEMTMQEKLVRVQQEAASQMKELHSEKYIRQRKVEQYRAREAALFFQHQQRSHSLRFHKVKRPSANAGSLKTFIDEEAAAMDAELVNLNVEKQIRKRFAQFSLHDQHTFTPDEDAVEILQTKNIRRKAREEADHFKNDRFKIANLPPILPPLSMREKAINANSRGTALTDGL